MVSTVTINEVSAQDIRGVRAERGLDLLNRKRALITHVRDDRYVVPSDDDKRSYEVRYGGAVEHCECTDFGVHRGESSCKHLCAVGLMLAARRSGVREVRTVRVVAGDPFKAAKPRLTKGEKLALLEERLRHELMPDEERQELRDRLLAELRQQ